MNVTFTQNAWEDYQYWQKTDKKVVKKLNDLIKAIMRELFAGVGKPEALKYDLAGYWSRRLSLEHRIVYKITDSEQLIIIACRFLYD